MLYENKLLMFLVKKKHTLICGGNAELINISTQCRKTRAKSIYDWYILVICVTILVVEDIVLTKC